MLDTQKAENPAHSAIVLYHLGRVPLDNGDPAEALRLFQLGQIAAQDSRSSAAVALLLTHEALAYAHLNDPRQAMTALRRAEDEYVHATEDDWPEFLEFFDTGALNTSAARVHSRLGLIDQVHRAEAVSRLNTALADGPTNRVRQRAFNLIWLATCTITDGDLSGGAQIGHQALGAVRTMKSPRLIQHLAPLQAQVRRYPDNNEIRQLAHEVQLLRPSA